jgi:hypothetical protein
MQRAVAIPELRDAFLYSFAESCIRPADLLRCALVCKGWSWPALRLLWRGGDWYSACLDSRELERLVNIIKIETEVRVTRSVVPD